jgi:hypothetical protein
MQPPRLLRDVEQRLCVEAGREVRMCAAQPQPGRTCQQIEAGPEGIGVHAERPAHAQRGAHGPYGQVDAQQHVHGTAQGGEPGQLARRLDVDPMDAGGDRRLQLLVGLARTAEGEPRLRQRAAHVAQFAARGDLDPVEVGRERGQQPRVRVGLCRVVELGRYGSADRRGVCAQPGQVIDVGRWRQREGTGADRFGKHQYTAGSRSASGLGTET